MAKFQISPEYSESLENHVTFAFVFSILVEPDLTLGTQMDAKPSKKPDSRRMAELATMWSDVQPSVAAFIQASVRDQHDAEDLLQETIYFIAEHLKDYDSTRPFVAWALGIARYRVLEYRNMQKRELTLLSKASITLLRDAIVHLQPEADSRHQALEVCVSQLTEDHRDIIRKRYSEGQSVGDIARELQQKANTITVKLLRIRKALSQCVKLRLKAEAEND